MKTKIPHLTLFTAVVALFTLTGCNTVSTSVKQDIGGPTYAPSNPAQVQILRTPPTRPHVRLGEVTAEPSSDSVPVKEIEAALQKAAAKMGADAAVVVYDKTQTTGAYVTGPWWGRSVQAIQGRVIIAVAIHYTGP
jgi:predicted small secreted protein